MILSPVRLVVLLSAASLFTLPLCAEDIPEISTDMAETAATPLPVIVPLDDAHLHYVGRFHTDAASGAVCAWAASSITINFHGTAINADIDLGKNRFEVVVDGQPIKVLAADAPGTHLYNLATDLPAVDHLVTLFKDTEAMVGTATFHGFQLNEGATLLAVPTADKRIEVIGDSISDGYGNEATNEKENFSPKTENAYWTYGALTARSFGAEYACYAWSGKKLWPNNTIPEIYDRILPQDPKSALWNYDNWKPNVVLINLCTNDFGKGIPEEEGWVKAYHEFIVRVRKNYPDAVIYLAIGPMMSDQYPANENALTVARGYIQRVVKETRDGGDARIRFIEFPTQDGAKNGLGANWHPSLKTHQNMADKFISTLETDLNWRPLGLAPTEK